MGDAQTIKQMQIKARIRRIESRVKQNYSPFCACQKSPRFEIVLEDKDIQTVKNPIADFCERCGKAIEKRRIILELIESREQIEDIAK